MALAVVATAVAVIALTIVTTRSAAPSPSATATAPAYTAAGVSVAHQKLCDGYGLAARAVKLATNGDNPALSGVATVNGAVILEHTVGTTPAIPADDRAVALALAEASSNAQATATAVQQRDPLWQSTISDVNAKDTEMKKACGGG
jgi:hypothetical protein